MAQLGSAPALGAGGRRFESCLPDHGSVPKWPKGSDCKSDGSAFVCSNHTASTNLGNMMKILNSNIKAENYIQQYKNAQPFENIIIDNFLDEDLANNIAEYLEAVDISDWYHNPSQEQVNKWWMPDLERLNASTSQVLDWFNGQESIEFFQNLTGVGDLIPDSEYMGGGVHITTSGGSLDVHADFNFHPNLDAHRRLNALLFLNKNWDHDWGGQLQLWDKKLIEPQKIIEPIFNRLVLFNVTDEHFHGFPDPIKCPPNRRRLSLALYYYTKERPEYEKNPFHWVLWKNTKK